MTFWEEKPNTFAVYFSELCYFHNLNSEFSNSKQKKLEK
jgi:hypothetical protein